MAIPLFNSIASWFLKKRIHQIELFIKYPNEVQQEVLQDLLGFAKKLRLVISTITVPLIGIASLHVVYLSSLMKTLLKKLQRVVKGRIIFFGPHPLSGMQNLVGPLTQKVSTSL